MDLREGQSVTYTNDSGGEVPGRIVRVAEAWTTGVIPIKVRLRGGAQVWTGAWRLEASE